MNGLGIQHIFQSNTNEQSSTVKGISMKPDMAEMCRSVGNGH